MVRIGPNSVRLGIEAPPQTVIVRTELIGRSVDGSRTEMDLEIPEGVDIDVNELLALTGMQGG